MPTCHSTRSLAGQAGYAIQQQLLQQEVQLLHSVSTLLSSHFTGELLTSCCQRRQQQGIMSEVVLNAPRHAETYMHTCHKMPRCALELQLNCTLKSSRAKLVPQIWHGCTRHPSQRGDKSLDSRLWLTSPRGAMTSRRSRRRSGSPQQVPERWSACIRCLRWGTRGPGCILRVTSTPT